VYKRSPKKEFEKLMFHEYEQVYLKAYPQAFESLNSTFYYQLHCLYPLRNKIAHNHCLDEIELKEFNGICGHLKSFLIDV
jgi:hypothetical protein